MMRLPFRPGSLLALSLLALAAGCARPAEQSRASLADRAACRQRADEVYTLQNRDAVYRADSYATSTRDSPYASNGTPGVTTSDLFGQYARQQMVSDCLNSVAGNVGAAPAAPAADQVQQKP